MNFFGKWLCVLSLFFLSQLEAKEKIALLFLTIKELNHSSLWQEEIEKNEGKFSVYIHSKEPLKDPFFQKFRIPTIIQNTTTAFHSKAWPELFKEALKEEANKKFVLLSESCIPLFSLSNIYDRLICDEKTYISYGRPWWPETHGREVIEIPKEHRFANQEWVIFNRKHAELVASDTTVISCVSLHRSDSESYFSTLLSFYGYLDQPDVVNQATTYVNWENAEDGHPYTFKDFNYFNLALMKEAKLKKKFFARKFSKTFPKEKIKDFIYENEG